MYVRENLQYFQNIKKNLKLGNFTTSYWSFGQYWWIYIFMCSVYWPSELCEVAQIQKFFSLNLLKSICIQSSIMVKPWIIHKNQFWALFLMKYCIFAKNDKNEQKKCTFLANWASSMNFCRLARLEMYVRHNYLYFQKIKKILKLGNFILIFLPICIVKLVDFDTKIIGFLWI